MMQRARDLYSRRVFLSRAAQSAAGLGLGLCGGAIAVPVAHAAGADNFGPLGSPDSNELRLPAGFTSRVVATSGSIVGSSGFTWHTDPDGGAVFPRTNGGWVYVSNAEVSDGGGGVNALQFSASGAVETAYSILTGTTRNCAGGATPWNTWLSCEETSYGSVWECDPMSPESQGVVRPALGVFNHEAATVDPLAQQLYLTEDTPDSLLYRFSPSSYPDLCAGILEAAEILDPGSQGAIAPGQVRPLDWHVVPDPSAATTETRFQVASATQFNGGEGCDYRAGDVFFSTKGDNRVWRIDTLTNQIEILYDRATSPMNNLSGVDNVFAAPNADIYIAEDGGNLEIVALTQSGQVKPIVQVTGQPGSEITGPALSPDGTRLYFSSQRNPGTTYEISGPFVAPATPVLGGIGQLVLVAAMACGAGLGLRARKSLVETEES